MKLFFLTVSLVTAYASEPGNSGSFTEAQPFPNEPAAGDYSYVDEALQMMDGRLVIVDEQNNPIYSKTGDMSMLLGRSRWCRSRDGECRRGKFSCPHRYESPYGRPYCTSIKRRCCYPGKGPTSTIPTPTKGPTSTTPTPIASTTRAHSTTTSIPTTTVASTTRAHYTTTFPEGSGWCSSRDGECRRGNYLCPYKYESPFGSPYCTSRLRRCCYPGKGPTSTTQTPITGPTSTTPTQISTTTSIPTETVDSTTRAHSTTTFPGSGWCSSRDGECRRGNYLCPYKYESPFGSPYCTSRLRRCCYPGKGTNSTTQTPTKGPTSTTTTPISTTTSIPTEIVDLTTRAHSTTTFPVGSGWCSSRDGECRRGNYRCPYKYESPFGSPYCTSRLRRCCYPGKGPTSTTPTQTTGPTFTTPTPSKGPTSTTPTPSKGPTSTTPAPNSCDTGPTSTTPTPKCPEGFFKLNDTEKSYCIFHDERRTWCNAKSKCEAYQLTLAEPQDPVAMTSYLTTTYGLVYWTWLGARGNGDAMAWESDGDLIINNSPYWRPGRPEGRVSNTYCAVLLTSPYGLLNYPNSPYESIRCDSTRQWTLCELVTLTLTTVDGTTV